jgi:hypothetical protein
MFSLGQIAYEERDYCDALIWFRRASDAGHHRFTLFHRQTLLERPRSRAEQERGEAIFSPCRELQGQRGTESSEVYHEASA